MANWFFLALGGLGAGFLIARTRTEEHKLIDRFGDAYRQLMQRMGRYWPKVRRGP
jgi:protein-S-isoprenylcysteine O-methyltransferase Ste14